VIGLAGMHRPAALHWPHGRRNVAGFVPTDAIAAVNLHPAQVPSSRMARVLFGASLEIKAISSGAHAHRAGFGTAVVNDLGPTCARVLPSCRPIDIWQ